MPAPILDNLDDARRFLSKLHEHETGWLSLFATSRTWSGNRTMWAELPDVDSLIARIKTFVGHADVWVGVAPRRKKLTGSKRGSASDCLTIPGLWIDVDVYDADAHAAEDLPRTFDEARKLINDFPLPPSLLIHTGHGYQAYWLFQEPLEVDDAHDLIARWGTTWTELSKNYGWGIDNVWDFARILRVPGTLNNKTTTPVPVTFVTEEWDRRYGVDDIDQWLQDPKPPPGNERQTLERTIPYIGPERPGDAFNASADPGLILERHGFVFSHEDNGDRHYYAPHRAASKERTGATVYGADKHTTIWSGTFARAAGMDEKRPYDPFGLYTHLEHRGNWTKATQALRDAGYGAQPVDLADLLPTMPPPAPIVVDGHEDDDDDWARRDVTTVAREIIAGERQRPEPVILTVEGGKPLIYQGRTHSLFGPPGGGKTWVALAAAAEHLHNGGHVLMIDWEDHIDGAVGRMVQLGCTVDELERFDYRSPSTSLVYGWATLEADPTPWTLVVMDSAGEAMSAGGVNPNDDGEVAAWMMLAKRLTRRPERPAVLMLDHVPKASDTPHTFAIGSQRKLAAITGASYRCDTLIEPAIGKPGKLKLVVAKDRLGHRAKASTAAEVHLVDDDALIEITLKMSDAQAAAERGERFRPTVLMERVSRWLEIHPGATKNTIRKEVQGKAAAVDTALEVLIEEGYVAVVKDGQSHVHTVVKDYREAADELSELVDNSNRVPVSHRVPTVSPVSRDTAESDRVPRVPGGHIPGTRDTVQGVQDAPTVSPSLGPVDFFAEANPNRPADDFLF